MGHSYISWQMHFIFSTKGRRNYINADLQTRLWPYMSGIARENGMKALTVGGTDNHVHLLLSLPATVTPAKAIQVIKGGSSKWISETFPTNEAFAWQEGYAAFSVSLSKLDDTAAYIRDQARHHGSRTFEEEYLEFLKKHGIQYDERYVLD